jgi:hypothetical protein
MATEKFRSGDDVIYWGTALDVLKSEIVSESVHLVL